MLKIIELFAGVGSQTQALKNIGVEHEVVGIAEIDKYAIQSYEQLHGKVNNYGDISKIERLDEADLWSYSFPCQDLSVAGSQKGINENTRSGLLYEVERLLKVSEKPKYLLMENVKNLVSKKFKPDFDKWCEVLENLGYENHWQILNAKDYGVPQNRERVFMVSILSGGSYKFPEKQELKIRLKDVLEENVEGKYYLSQKVADRFKFKQSQSDSEIIIEGSTAPNFRTIGQRDIVFSTDGIMGSLMATDYKQPKQILLYEPKILQVGNTSNPRQNFDNPQEGSILSPLGVSPTLNTCYPHSIIEPLKVKNATKLGYQEAEPGDYVNLQFPDSKTRRGRVQKDVSATLMCNDANGTVTEDYRIRKLTPRECWRLMGWTDEQFDKIKGVSDAQLYKQAGNGIVVSVLEAIFTNLFLSREV